MAFSLQIPDLKDRMLNVFGNFLKQLGIFPKVADEDQEKPLAVLSNEEDNGCNFLASISLNRVTGKLKSDSFEGAIAEAFEIYILLLSLADGLPHSQTAKILQKASFTPD